MINELINYIIDAFWSLFPIFIVFTIFQILKYKLSLKRFMPVLIGMIISFIGFTLFLYGVNIGFINVGILIGEKIASLSYNWILIPIGFILGFFVTLAEPAIFILCEEVERITTGYINKKIFIYFLSIGVSISVSLSMVRVLTGISLWCFLLPGYIISLVLMHYVSPLFIAIAFDSGGVVTGPMIATFILALNVGSSKIINTSNVIMNSFGMIALVALVPILTILILGLLYERSSPLRRERSK